MNTNERIKIFKSLMGQVFGKEDVDYFVATLRRMGYFTTPASTKYHGNYEGGLFDHSLEVTKSLLHLTKHLKLHWNSRKSPYFVGMFHDLCKCDNSTFTTEMEHTATTRMSPFPVTVRSLWYFWKRMTLV